MRLFVYGILFSHTSRNGNPTQSSATFVMTSILVTLSLFYAIVQPYKKRYMNNVESVLYASSGLLLMALTLLNQTERDIILRVNTVMAAALLPSGVVLAVFAHQLMRRISKKYDDS